MTTATRKFDLTAGGQAFQGDIAIVPMPASVKINTADEIKPIDGRLIIQEGEITGHHHKIVLPAAIAGRRFAPERQLVDPSVSTASPHLARHFGGGKKAPVASARMYRDLEAVTALRDAGVITRTDLAVGCLVVEGGPVTVTHEEHDGIELPVGRYYVGRQLESAGAEERVVAD